MTHLVLGASATLMTAAGSAWYVPAYIALRAGADRPPSHRTAATACLTGWATVGGSALVLFLTEGWWPVAVPLTAGAATTTALRLRAAILRRRESKEAARDWAELRAAPPVPIPRRPRALLVTALCMAAAMTTGVAALVTAYGVGAD
ncbi:hypothetical protein [Streptomyces sp. LaPpAH-108]|uniref:hypothetical protein n=1 Tax=Streptomyces sp. LaPpAH-108 TaxID=1155714 RepID=UPI00036E9999|nr:hypothetical protein [Streptomyces sp. LaPpAH-108]